MLPAFFASKIAIRNKEELTIPIKKTKAKQKVPSPPGKKISIKNHQFIRLLYNAYIACDFQFFPRLPMKTPTLSLSLPPQRPRVPERAGRKS